ncbi:MAG TPA: sigma 54-interacting transcriptional regulator [Kofleriaceae bacterium]|nr:sigma 54-interacting transcriptional regulator [Kofleriaceae bacterium]
MMGDPQELSTEITQRGEEAAVASSPRRPTWAPALTIVHHPALRRIGDRVILGELVAGREARISRTAPRFAAPRQPGGAPLDHARISRAPFVLRPRGDGGVILDPDGSRTRITADGDAVDRPRSISPDELHRGVVLELSDRIALLLHLFAAHAERDTGDLGLVGHSDHIARVRDDIRRVAALDVPVLIRGETGTGKELVAAAIHESGARARGPLVCVNMAALPPQLAAAELFGATRGAFTGAMRGQDGYFRRAAGGTLFLDEIGAAPAEVQVMLLRALETAEIYALGAQRPERVDVRILAATDARLEELIARGAFGAPLLHRLAGYEIHIPPLRERRDDIARLLLHFLGLDLAETGDTELLDRTDAAPWMPLALTRRIMQHDWPGNVRQLRNVVRQIVIGSRGHAEASLSPALLRQLTAAARALSQPEPEPEPFDAPASAVERLRAAGSRRCASRKPAELTEDELVDALCAHRWDIKSTAAALGISRTSLYKRIDSSERIRTAGHLGVEEIRACHRDVGGDLDAMVERLRVSKPALRRRIQELGLA